MGFIYGNPFHEIALDTARRANVRFMVNAVQDPHKQFFNFVAGGLAEAHAAGVQMCRRVSEVPIPKRGDIIIASRDGFGEETFHQWMAECPTIQSIIDRYADEGFNVGNNKAFNYARALKKGRVIIVTDRISAQDLKEAKLESAPTLQEAFDMAYVPGTSPVVTVLGQAANIIPVVL